MGIDYLPDILQFLRIRREVVFGRKTLILVFNQGSFENIPCLDRVMAILDDVGHFLFGEFGSQSLHGLISSTIFLRDLEDAEDQRFLAKKEVHAVLVS